MSNHLNARQGVSVGPGPQSLPIPSFTPLPVSTTSRPIPPITTAPGLPLSTGPVDTSSSSPPSTPTLPLSIIPISSPSPSTNASSSTSSTAPAPTGSPSIDIATPSNATTCTPLQIRWSVSNPSSVDLSQATLALTLTGTANTTLVDAQPLLSTAYTWPAVSVPPGTYTLLGVEGSLSTQSKPFSVQAGSDTSCLEASQSNSPGKSKNVGAIAGGTIGGVLLLASAAVACFFLCGLRKRPSSKHGRGIRRGWGGLGSFDGKAHGVTSGESNDYLGARSLATGPAHVDSDTSLDGEKGLGAGTAAPAGTLTVLAHHHPNWSQGTRASLELARLPSRNTPAAAQDSPRSSFDLTDPFATPGAQSRRASRTPRKPVPTYEPTPEELDAIAMGRTRSDHSQRSRASHISTQSPSTPSAFSHNASSSLSNTNASHDPMVHSLKSKSSAHFDGQPVHYLIPDMPPQQRADY